MMIRGLAIPNSTADVDPSISGLWLLRNVGLSETMSQTGRYKCNKLVKRPFFLDALLDHVAVQIQ